MAHGEGNDRATEGGPLPREFTDAAGVRWTVREITPGPMPPKLSAFLGEDRRRGDWLLFLAENGEKRRLAPVPHGWTGMGEAELAELCTRASRVPPAPGRRLQDREPPT
jgi:hypothetical protein